MTYGYNEGALLVTPSWCIPSDEKTAKEVSSEYRRKVPNIHGHYRQHTDEQSVISGEESLEKYLQQVANTGDDSIDNSTNRICGDSPRSASNTVLLDDHDLLF